MDTVGPLTAAVPSYKHLQFQFNQSTEIHFNAFFGPYNIDIKILKNILRGSYISLPVPM